MMSKATRPGCVVTTSHSSKQKGRLLSGLFVALSANVFFLVDVLAVLSNILPALAHYFGFRSFHVVIILLSRYSQCTTGQ
jgi:hypothetical protein